MQGVEGRTRALRVRRFLIDEWTNARLKIAPPGTVTLDFDRQLPDGIPTPPGLPSVAWILVRQLPDGI